MGNLRGYTETLEFTCGLLRGVPTVLDAKSEEVYASRASDMVLVLASEVCKTFEGARVS